MAMASTSTSSSSCPKAVSIYAMQKTGSSFLNRFLNDIALHRRMCRTYQITKEFVCETTMFVDCPRNDLHRKTVSLRNTFSPDGQPRLARSEVKAKSKGSGGAQRNYRCTRTERRKMFDDSNDWLRSTDVTVKYRYNRSLEWLLSADGFVRTSRQLYAEHADAAVPGFPGYDNVLIVHTRHPVEMMVSAYHCIANPSVCPVRSKFLGAHVPKNDTIKSLDEFVLKGVRRPGSTPWTIMQRNRAINDFIRGFQTSALRSSLAQHVGGCPEPVLLHSTYEFMVTNFSVWAAQILETVVAPIGQRRALHSSLVAAYKNDFVPKAGTHKNALVAGSNLAKLKKSTVKELVRDPQVNTLLREMGYHWFGWDRT
jgi:hypothetical protein